MSTAIAPNQSRMRIKPQLSCPHCWHEFPTHQILFISESPDLNTDPKLEGYQQLRFIPSRFDLSGNALDAHNTVCHKLACPKCHLQIPRPLLSTSSFFVSIAGAPSSGKSYFFTSMVWQLRKTMPRDFLMSFTDADTMMNKRIREHEAEQFMGGEDPNQPVKIAKTEEVGDIYNTSLIDGRATTLAQPFSFTVTPLASYPFPKNVDRVTQTVCMYDNAGEHFYPGADHIQTPVTRHLAASDAIMFLFDPTQDLRFRTACKEPVDDPQMSGGTDVRRSKVDQSTILTEMISRIKTHSRMAGNERIKIPLIIVLTKLDAWKQLTKFTDDYSPWNPTPNVPTHFYNVGKVEKRSQELRTLLNKLIPELVGTAEASAEKVTYIAVSATGCAPELGEVPQGGGERPLLCRPANIKPIWIEVPFFQAQLMAGKYCVPIFKRK